MTEAEWGRTNTNPIGMLEFVRDKASDRKFCLFTTAYCRSVRALLRRPTRSQVEFAEAVADGVAARGRWPPGPLREKGTQRLKRSLNLLALNALGYCCGMGFSGDVEPELNPGAAAVEALRMSVYDVIGELIKAGRLDPDWPTQVFSGPCTAIRDIFGSSFRPIACSADWRTATAVALGRQMYESRDFGAMPILADALQEAGCDNPDILDHCRGSGPHVRGCWVVDLVLGRE
jgi:hypothetical protein